MGGQKVNPLEIAEMLQEIPGIEAVHIYKADDPITGHKVCARIVTSDARDALTWKRTIRNHCRSKLAPWKIPSRIVISDQLSVTARLKHSVE
ncbi:MAG: hypothetical protein EA353_12065 [Puniceicoccaceae bacterium]|nr:MAG: hypothetical protein EA353_12065 [Puniceicoccaceae bacterium]